MAFIRISDNRYLCSSTDTKLTSGVNISATVYEWNTGYLFIFNGYAWVPKPSLPEQSVNYKQISLAGGAGNSTVMTATAQDLFIDAVIVSVPDDISAVASFTGLTVQTNDGTPIEILSAAAGDHAKLTGNFYHVFRGPSVIAATKIIQLTITGATAGAGKVADITVLWRPLVAGGYMLNA